MSFARELGGSVRALACAAGLVVLALASSAHAQRSSGTLAMTADNTNVAVGGTFRIEIVGSSAGSDMSDPIPPDLSMFETLSRQSFRPTSIRLGGGGVPLMVQSEVRLTFVLRASTPGTYALDPARMRVGGVDVRSNPLTITVSASGGTPTVGSPGGPPGTPPGTAASPPTGGLDGALYDDQAFLRTVVDHAEAVVGEQVTVTVYLYIRGSLTSMPMATHEPGVDGFWVHDLVGPTNPMEPTTQMVGSTRFAVYMLRRFAAFPLREGTLTVGAMSVAIPRGSPIDIFMGTPQPDLERTGVDVPITVHALPTDGRPSTSVEPHVGTLSLTAALDRDQVPTGDAVTLTVTATGAGMMSAVSLGDLEIEGVRVLSPQTDGDVSAPGDRVSGTRRFEWLLVPEREGSHVIPAFRVPVFDPATHTWSVAESAPLTLVAAGNPVAPTTPADEPEIAAPDVGGAPIEYGPVRTDSTLLRRRARLAAQGWYAWSLAVPPILALLVVVTRSIRRRMVARGEGDAAGKAAREGKKRLADAEAKAKAGDARGLYGAITLAIRSVVEGRLGESVGSLTHLELRKKLGDRGMKTELAKKVVDELESAEFARFATSAAAPAEMDAAITRARALVGELDRFTATPLED